PAEEARHRAVTADTLSRLAQVGGRRERDDRKPGPLRRPVHELASCGTAGKDDPLLVGRAAVEQLAGERDGPRHVISRARPRPTAVAASPVLHVPGPDPGAEELHAEMSGGDQVVLGLPGAAVHENDERERPVAGR